MSWTVAPGKHVTALMKRMCLVMESPMINVVGGRRGRGGGAGAEVCGLPGQDSRRSATCIEDGGSGCRGVPQSDRGEAAQPDEEEGHLSV